MELFQDFSPEEEGLGILYRTTDGRSLEEVLLEVLRPAIRVETLVYVTREPEPVFSEWWALTGRMVRYYFVRALNAARRYFR